MIDKPEAQRISFALVNALHREDEPSVDFLLDELDIEDLRLVAHAGIDLFWGVANSLAYFFSCAADDAIDDVEAGRVHAAGAAGPALMLIKFLADIKDSDVEEEVARSIEHLVLYHSDDHGDDPTS
jgi:hypothetical protein